MIAIDIKPVIGDIEPAFRAMRHVRLPLDTLCIPMAGGIIQILAGENIEVRMEWVSGSIATFSIVEIAMFEPPLKLNTLKYQPPFLERIGDVVRQWRMLPPGEAIA